MKLQQPITILFATFRAVDKDADPNDSLMSLMKQMYEDGDDEMKRTIAKAWTESRDKQTKGDLPLWLDRNKGHNMLCVSICI